MSSVFIMNYTYISLLSYYYRFLQFLLFRCSILISPLGWWYFRFFAFSAGFKKNFRRSVLETRYEDNKYINTINTYLYCVSDIVCFVSYVLYIKPMKYWKKKYMLSTVMPCFRKVSLYNFTHHIWSTFKSILVFYSDRRQNFFARAPIKRRS